MAACRLPGLLSVVLEEVARLQGRNRRVVGRGRQMHVARIIAALHAAIADLALQLRIAIDRRDEAIDLAMPVLGGAGLEFISDQGLFHRTLLRAR